MVSYMMEVLVFILLPSACAHGNFNDGLALVQGAVRTHLVSKFTVFDAADLNMTLPAHVRGSLAHFYETLLPEDVNLVEERKMWKDSPAGVHVVEQHHQALRWWLRATISKAHANQVLEQKRRLLVHVDSHEDVGVDVWDDVPHSAAKTGRAGLAQFMSREASIGSFISPGVVAGLVSDVVWLRSDFRHSTYNGPSPGLYKVGFFLVSNGKSVCQKIIGQDDELKQKGENRDKMLNIKVEEFNTCGSDDMKHVRDPFATFNMIVTDLPNFQEDLERFLAHSGTVPISEWWLDVDEDYFASYIPGWHNLADFLRADFKAEDMSRIRSALSRLHKACGDTHDTRLIKTVRRLPWQARGHWKAWRKMKCHLKKGLKQELVDVTRDLSSRQRKAWDKGIRNLYQNDYVSGDAFTIFDKDGEMPYGLPSTKEIAHTMSLLEGSLRHVVQQLGRPQVLTACRSILNGYLPHKLWPFIEPHLQDTLRRALGDPELRMVPDAANPPISLYAGMQ